MHVESFSLIYEWLESEYESECDLELNLFALKLEKVSTIIFLSASNLQRIIFIFFCLLPIVHILFFFFSHNVEMFKSLSGGVVIYVFFGTNPLIIRMQTLHLTHTLPPTRHAEPHCRPVCTQPRAECALFCTEDRIMDV